MEENKIFHLGLCLAGSVSAGSYTAGVLDYLLDALKIWEERKRQNLPDTPTQDVRISVIGGASGGGMTGIIGSSILQNEIIPVKFPTSLKEVLADQPQNKLYNAWVDMLGEDMFPMMLDTADIDKNKEITSLLNSDFIDKLANKLVKAKENKNRNFPGYIYSPLKVFLTLTNLAGFPYEISYRGNTTLNKYYMAVHNDYACFKLNTDEAEKDEWMPLDFATGKNVETARLAAMATGAFPIFLKSQVLSRETKEVNKIRWLKYVDPVQGNEYVTQNIDGGILNNEPFEIVRFVLNELTRQPDSTIYNDPDLFKSTILLIDPFPSEKPSDFKIDTGFLKTLAYTINCLIGQGRAKPGVLASSVNPDLAGQFMIAPSRRVPGADGKEKQVQGEKAIASSSLDGFGGFLSKEFRVHDYFLGRYNCEIMLRDYFVIPESSIDQNPIFKEGYSNVDKSKFWVLKKEKEIINGKEVEVEKKYFPIIPLFKERTIGFPVPEFSSGSNWPMINTKEVERFKPLITKRAQVILLTLLTKNTFRRILLWIGAKVVLNKIITKAIIEKIRNELIEHRLLK